MPGVAPSIRALNERLYAPFAERGIEWEGRQVPEGFGPRVRRLRRAGGVERRVFDRDAITESFLYHFALGLHYGYPECCVLQYACEVPVLSPLQLRGGITLGDYVPCDACLERYLFDYITDGKQWRRVPGPAAPA